MNKWNEMKWYHGDHGNIWKVQTTSDSPGLASLNHWPGSGLMIKPDWPCRSCKRNWLVWPGYMTDIIRLALLNEGTNLGLCEFLLFWQLPPSGSYLPILPSSHTFPINMLNCLLCRLVGCCFFCLIETNFEKISTFCKGNAGGNTNK